MLIAQPSRQSGLFRHFVCRVGGLPASLLEDLQAVGCTALIKELFKLEDQMREGRESVTEALFAQIGRCTERKARGALVQLKRDIHNLRLPRPAQIAKARPCLKQDLIKEIEEIRRRGLRCQELLEEFEAAHRRELAHLRASFQAMVADPDLQKGLLLSSRSLFRQTNRYTSAPPAKLNKKDRQAERSLMRYLSRTCMKATPFSTFCAVIAGHLSESGHNAESFCGNPRRKSSLIRLNKSLYSHILAHLLRHSETRRHFHVELNPTLREGDGRLVFLTALGAREVFQRMPKSPVLELLAGLFDSSPHRPLSALLEALCTNPQVEATAEEADAFVSRLLEIGFIRFRIGIREQEVDWDRLLKEILDRIGTRQASEASKFLHSLRQNAAAYAASPVADRHQLLEESVTLVEDSLKQLDPNPPEDSRKDAQAHREAEEKEKEQEGKGQEEEKKEEEKEKESDLPLPRSAVRMRTEIPFFEDAGAESSLSIAPRRLQGAADSLTEYVGLTLRLAEPRSAMATMRRFFDSYYQGERNSVPLLEFYEDYYREHFKEHLERMHRSGRPLPQAAQPKEGEGEEGAEEEELDQAVQEMAADEDPQEEEEQQEGDYNLTNPLKVELIDQIQEANKALRKLLAERWRQSPEAEAIDLQSADLQEALKGVPPLGGGCNSVSVFAQHLPGFNSDGTDGLVANTFLTGFGKYFSRFLSLFPASVEKDLYDENSRLSSQCLAEICGDAGFNANLHPPLLRWEISYPTGETGPSEIQLSTADLQVEPHPGDPDALLLRHLPSRKQVIPVDLGFLNPRMRPPLFQLLSRFTPPSSFSFPLPEAQATAAEEKDEKDKNSEEEEKGASDGQQQPQPVAMISYRPRITYRGCLVLARRRWQISADLYPRRAPGESEQDYFLKVNRWQHKHGFPQQAFVRVQPLPGPAKPGPPPKQTPVEDEKDEEASPQETDLQAGQPRQGTEEEQPKTPAGPAARQMRRHHYKPQYIDFRNPLLVELFGKVAENLHNFRVSLEERLPDRGHLPTHGEDRYATEFIVQVNFREGEVSRQDAKNAKC